MERVFSLMLLLMFPSMVVSAENFNITATDSSQDTVKLTCNKGNFSSGEKIEGEALTLEYKDENSKEYTCKNDKDEKKLLVKFRTCDNCIKLEAGTVVGIVCGDILATILIGVAVYFIASQPRARSYSNNKASDRQNLIPQQGNDFYMPLSHSGTDQYSELQRKPNRK